jgi:uncharacterized BrkB/YihY/UPF0761 family membrane protein
MAGEGKSGAGGWHYFAHLTTLVVRESARSFYANSSFEISAALATYAFFCFIPMVFFIAYLLGNFPGLSPAVGPALRNLMWHLFPNAEGFDVAGLYFSTQYKVTRGLAAVAILLFSLTSFSDTLRTALAKTFSVGEEPGFWRSQMLSAFAGLTALALFFILAVGEIAYVRLAGSVGRNFPLGAPAIDLILSLMVATGCMMVFYAALLPRRPSFAQLLGVSCVSALLIVGMRIAFRWYLAESPDYGIIFGTFQAMFVMLVWTYYCFLVILFGVEMEASIRKRDALLLKGLFIGRQKGRKRREVLFGKFLESYGSGTVIFREGEEGDCMFYVLSGSVAVLRGDTPLKTIGQGGYFGEMSMLLEAPRTATAVAAREETVLARISRTNFETILRENPKVMMAVLKEMTLRLKAMNESV